MEPTSLSNDAEFWLPPEFLTDQDFLVEKENKVAGIDDFNSYLLPQEDNFLAGLTRQMDQSSLEDDFSGGFFGNRAFPAGNDNKAWGGTRSPQSTLCAAGIGCGCRNQRSNQNCQSRVSSQAWDLYCDAAEEVARMNINDDHSGRGLLGPPRKLSSVAAAVKNPNDGSGYYSHPSLPYQKLQAIQFQQLKQQQLMKHHHRQLLQQSRGLGRLNSNKNGGPVDLSSSAWSNQPSRRDGSGMRAVFLGDQTGKRGSTGTGVFLPRRVNPNTSPATAQTRKKSGLATVLVPTRVAEVLNLNLDEPVRSSASFNDGSWRQRSKNGGFSNQMHGGVKAEQTVNEHRLPLDWAY